jgi:hypothetical protein
VPEQFRTFLLAGATFCIPKLALVMNCPKFLENPDLPQDRALCLLQKEIADLKEGCSRETAALSAQMPHENGALREELAKSDNSHEQEITALRKEQDSLPTQFAHEAVGLRKQFTEDIARMRKEQLKSGTTETALCPERRSRTGTRGVEGVSCRGEGEDEDEDEGGNRNFREVCSVEAVPVHVRAIFLAEPLRRNSAPGEEVRRERLRQGRPRDHHEQRHQRIRVTSDSHRPRRHVFSIRLGGGTGPVDLL